MVEEFLTRLWNAVKPPPPATVNPLSPRQITRKRRVIAALLTVVVLAAGFGVYLYLPAASQRADAEFKAGMKLMEPGNYGKAIAKFDHAASIMPNVAQVYLSRGIAHRNQNEIDLALADFDKAIELNSNLAAAHSARGDVLRERGDIDGAMAEFTRSIQIEPTVEGYYERGQVFESLGEHRKAIDDYDQAIALIRDAPQVYRARSLAKRNLGHIAGYRADRDKAKSMEQRRR
jgi:tetratricopeptide (TPR) repeat protein